METFDKIWNEFIEYVIPQIYLFIYLFIYLKDLKWFENKFFEKQINIHLFTWQYNVTYFLFIRKLNQKWFINHDFEHILRNIIFLKTQSLVQKVPISQIESSFQLLKE